MDANLNKIAQDLYKIIDSRFTDIKFGDAEGVELSKKTDIPTARFFEFDYKDQGVKLGTITITLDKDDGVLVELMGDLATKSHPGVFGLIKGLRQFSKDRLLNFHVDKVGKSNLDKRDYQFRSKPKEEHMMESKMYGTSKLSYQDLGEARLVIKHSQPVNPEVAAGRTMHIESIYVENSQGERFKYPFKHLNGARALAEHLKHGGIPYDAIGKHITSLSEELAQLRKFKGYVSRNDALSEAMGDITSKVFERIEQVKKEVSMLQRPAYYEQFAESFSESEEQMIPEEIMSDWIDRLTIRTFNEELKTAFPYIFRLVDETSIPVKELSADDILGEDDEEITTETIKPTLTYSPEDQFEAFIEGLMSEDIAQQNGINTLLSDNVQIRTTAITNLKQLVSSGIKIEGDGSNIAQATKGILDGDEWGDFLQQAGEGGDVATVVKLFVSDVANGKVHVLMNDSQETAKELIAQGGPLDQLTAGTTPPVGGEEVATDTTAAAPTDVAATPETPAPTDVASPTDTTAATPTTPEVPPTTPVAESEDEDPPFEPDAKPTKKTMPGKHGQGHSQAKHLAQQGIKKAIAKAKAAGADLDTKLDFGHKEMTLHDAIKESGLSLEECGFEEANAFDGMLSLASGFLNREEGNFTIGPQRVIIRASKEFPEHFDEEGKPVTEDAMKFVKWVHHVDPLNTGEHHQELGHIAKLAGVQNSAEVDECPDDGNMSGMLGQMQSIGETADAFDTMKNLLKKLTIGN